MRLFLLGLLIVLATHSVRLLAEDWRARMIERLGRWRWYGLFSLVSTLGFVLLVWGFGLAREQPVVIWQPPPALRHAAMTLMGLSSVLLAAALIPANHVQARVRHAATLSVTAWAAAHLLINGMLAHLLLFGTFGLWSVWAYVAARRRDRLQGLVPPPGLIGRTVQVVIVAGLLWLVFALWLHGWLIGIRPLVWG